jgi:hypothetical protein
MITFGIRLHYPRGKASDTLLMGDWVNLRAILGMAKKRKILSVLSIGL